MLPACEVSVHPSPSACSDAAALSNATMSCATGLNRPSPLGAGVADAGAPPRYSVRMKSSQALRKETGVFSSPKPNTYLPPRRSREASPVKSLTLLTMANASKCVKSDVAA